MHANNKLDVATLNVDVELPRLSNCTTITEPPFDKICIFLVY